MADITKINVYVNTADEAYADTNSLVYLSIAGREFLLKTSGQNFQRGANENFVLGDGANVTDAEYKDPRFPQLNTNDLDRYPVYIRMEPEGSAPGWLLERVIVTVNPDSGRPHEFDNLRLEGAEKNRKIWLHKPYGLKLYLHRS